MSLTVSLTRDDDVELTIIFTVIMLLDTTIINITILIEYHAVLTPKSLATRALILSKFNTVRLSSCHLRATPEQIS
jgi:hypothetical protein